MQLQAFHLRQIYRRNLGSWIERMFRINVHPRLIWICNQIFYNEACNEFQPAYRRITVATWDRERFPDADRN